ncbi:MAG: hypothetical protein AAFQ42_12770 [Pseudomonadota bacterium]
MVHSPVLRRALIALSCLFLLATTGSPVVANAGCDALIATFSTRGSGLPDNARLAVCHDVIKTRADNGDVRADVVRGYLSQKGIRLRRSARRARKAYERGSAKDLGVAHYLLGNFLARRIGASPADMRKAEALLKRAIAAGEPAAVPVLVKLYRSGALGPKSDEEIAALFATTKDGGPGTLFSQAKFLLETGNAVKRAEAEPLLRRAVEKGHPEAHHMLALVELSRATSESGARADRLLRDAIRLGHVPALNVLGRRQLAAPDVASQREGVRLLKQAADADDIDAAEALGTAYAEGRGTAPRFDLAKKYWFAAAVGGSDFAKLSLLYNHARLTKAEQLNVNGAFSSADGFKTDIGRVLLGNHYLSMVERGRRGEFIKGEYFFYTGAMRAFQLASTSKVPAIAEDAQKIANHLSRNKHLYEKDLEARRARRKTQFWVGIAVAGVALLALAGRNAQYQSSTSVTEVDTCAGINGLGWYGSSWATAAAFVGCRPY